MGFFQGFAQWQVLPELFDWAALTGWTAIMLLLCILFFAVFTPLHARKTWWQYLILLLMGGLAVWSIIIAYNSYQAWLNFNAGLPIHGVSAAFNQIRKAYLAAIQTCQFQFILTVSTLVLVLLAAIWQSGYVFARRRRTSDRHRPLWVSIVLFALGLCSLALGVCLILQLYIPLIYAPQDFSFVEPTNLELVGLFVATLSGPLILWLFGVSSLLETHIGARHERVSPRLTLERKRT